MDFKKQLMRDMGERFSERRKAMGWTQERAAEAAEVSQQAISDSENGKTMLMPDSMLKLCIAYDLSADFVLTGKVADMDVVLVDKRVRTLSPDQFFHYKAITEHYLSAVGLDETEGDSVSTL